MGSKGQTHSEALLSLAHIHRLDVCKLVGYKKLVTWRCTHVSSGRIAEGELQQGLKQLPVIRNRGDSRLTEVTDTWEPMGKSIVTVQNWPY